MTSKSNTHLLKLVSRECSNLNKMCLNVMHCHRNSNLKRSVLSTVCMFTDLYLCLRCVWCACWWHSVTTSGRSICWSSWYWWACSWTLGLHHVSESLVFSKYVFLGEKIQYFELKSKLTVAWKGTWSVRIHKPSNAWNCEEANHTVALQRDQFLIQLKLYQLA